MHSLYDNYRQSFERWQANSEAQARGLTPPVFVVVCNNTNVSKMVFDYIAGWVKQVADEVAVVVPGSLALFSNEEHGRWSARPNTILVDSQQLESGEGMSPEFKKIAAVEIEEFKAEYRARFPGRSTDDLRDEDLLREVMNTVGKAGKLGERVRCVVSVSMLTEGWDANTVTHILGVRAFGTQLLCEQVVGRGLRRMSYAVNAEGLFDAEYAEGLRRAVLVHPVFGIESEPAPWPDADARAGAGRSPRLRDHVPAAARLPLRRAERASVGDVHDDSKLALSTADIPTRTENAPIVGERSVHTLDDLKRHRENEVAFLLAKLTLEKYFRQDNEQKTDRPSVHRFDADVKGWLFPQVLAISKRWLAECVTCKDNTFPQLLLLVEFAHDAADRIYKAIVESAAGTPALRPILRPYDVLGSTRYVDFDTTKAVYPTAPDKCHVSHVVADTGSWEQKMAQALEEMPEVARYVKNQSLGFTIPYTLNGEEKQYHFIACD